MSTLLKIFLFLILLPVLLIILGRMIFAYITAPTHIED
jgi:hypothetical protein